MFIRLFGMRKLESKCLSCVRESRNEHDRYVVAVVKDGVVRMAFTQGSIKDFFIIST